MISKRILCVLAFFINLNCILGSETYKSIMWDPQNPLFIERKSNCDPAYKHKLLKVRSASKIKFICPNVATVLKTTQSEVSISNKYENLWLLYNKASFDKCDTKLDPANIKKPLLRCTQPRDLEFYSITFQRYAAEPNELTFTKGQSYYLIATSNGLISHINDTSGGHCNDTTNKVYMKIEVYVCNNTDQGEDPKCESGVGELTCPKELTVTSSTTPTSTLTPTPSSQHVTVSSTPSEGGVVHTVTSTKITTTVNATTTASITCAKTTAVTDTATASVIPFKAPAVTVTQIVSVTSTKTTAVTVTGTVSVIPPFKPPAVTVTPIVSVTSTKTTTVTVTPTVSVTSTKTTTVTPTVSVTSTKTTAVTVTATASATAAFKPPAVTVTPTVSVTSTKTTTVTVTPTVSVTSTKTTAVTVTANASISTTAKEPTITTQAKQQTPKSDSSTDKEQTWMAIAMVFIVSFIVLLVSFIVLCFFCRKKKCCGSEHKPGVSIQADGRFSCEDANLAAYNQLQLQEVFYNKEVDEAKEDKNALT